MLLRVVDHLDRFFIFLIYFLHVCNLDVSNYSSNYVVVEACNSYLLDFSIYFFYLKNSNHEFSHLLVIFCTFIFCAVRPIKALLYSHLHLRNSSLLLAPKLEKSIQ
jgi:hypothetical protein